MLAKNAFFDVSLTIVNKSRQPPTSEPLCIA